MTLRPTPTVAAFGRVTRAGTSTRRSLTTSTRQARRQPSRSSAVENARVSSDVIGAAPSRIRTLHLRHVPCPPHVESMATPFQLAASKSITPGGTRTFRPAGSKRRSSRPRPSPVPVPPATLVSSSRVPSGTRSSLMTRSCSAGGAPRSTPRPTDRDRAADHRPEPRAPAAATGRP